MKMKKNNLLILAVAALGFAACSSDETTAVNEKLAESNAISFRTTVAGHMRSTDATISNLASFTVDAYKTGTFASTPVKYFGDVVFTKVSDTQTYTSATKYYWPSGYNLDFFAYGYASTINTGITKDRSNQFTVITQSAPDNQVDLLYARSENWGKAGAASGHAIPTDKEGVVLNFRHAQSQIIINLKNSNDNLKFTVNRVRVGNLKDRGQVTIADANTDASGVLASATWDTSITGVDDATYDVEATAATVVTSSVQAGKSLILIPQVLPTPATTYEGTGTPKEYTKPYILVDLKIQNNATGGDAAYIVGAADNTGAPSNPEYVTAMWPLPALTWAAGYKYIYTVDLAGGGYYEKNNDTDDDLDPILEGAEIKFVEVTVNDWATENYTVGNMVYAKGGTYTANIPATAGTYTITITGLTSGVTPTVTGTVNCTSPTCTTVGTTGTTLVTCNVTAGSGTSVITVDNDGTGSGTETTVINLVQP